MAKPLTLKDLLEAISGAVIGAQDHIGQHQLAKLAGYFDENGRSRSFLVRVPTMRHGADRGEVDFYRARLRSLVPTQPIQFREVEVEFDIELGCLAEENMGAAHGNDPCKTLQVTALSSTAPTQDAVHMTITIQRGDTSATFAKACILCSEFPTQGNTLTQDKAISEYVDRACDALQCLIKPCRSHATTEVSVS